MDLNSVSRPTSYAAHLQHAGETWPAFENMRMLEPSSFRFGGEANYLDHPSPHSTRGVVIAGRDQTAVRPRMLLVVLIAGPSSRAACSPLINP